MTKANASLLLVTLVSAEKESQKKTASLPAELIDRWGLSPGEGLRLRAGRRAVPMTLGTAATTGNGTLPRVTLPPSVLSQLGLAAGARVHLLRKSGELCLGPIVGIMAPRRSGLAKPYQAQTSLFRRVLAAAGEVGVVAFVFDFHDIRWGEKRIRGYSVVRERWVPRWYPLPDVVFDRATGKFPGGSVAAGKARQRLVQGYGIKLFNTRLGGKARLHRLMSGDEVLRRHLPHTYQVRGSGAVERLLRGHGGVYLKPQNGAQGKGIVRLRRSPGGYRYTLTTSNYQRVSGRATTVAGALGQLRRRVALSTYIAQPDLNLLRLNGRICDVRILVQRDGDGAWHVTGTAVRAGAPGSVISNLHGGGRALQLESLLRKSLGADQNAISSMRDEMESLALRVAAVLSRATACLGELGVDLGIDTKGQVWIIEANSRTGRAVFRRCGLHDAARLADRRPLHFAMYLAGFTTQ